ncbi:MAG: 23S rRNA (uracil(1939)-C(5))-methyltransferase RlmD [Firmicutes bacterium]|nr:23S rRNA (uracil(1939)-C(5))-methyltransferase RlmD [Bacillota bacterium]
MKEVCPVFGKCGGCQYLNLSYEEQLAKKEASVRELFQEFELPISPITASDPYHYRCKVQMSFRNKDSRHLVSGTYAEASHRLIPVDECLLDDQRADLLIRDIRSLMEKFKLQAYDEKSHNGILRHVMVRIGKKTGEIMVILVTGSSFFPGKQNFVKELRKQHPEITTVVQNINGNFTSMVLGDKFQTIFGPGFIYDELLGKRFRLSPGAFFQVNPPQAEKLYEKALELADLRGTECVLDAYCGTGTIGILVSDRAREVVGIELNPQAVQDARKNASINKIRNIRFYQGDAGDFLTFHDLKPDVVIMDPPRSGSSDSFLSALIYAAPEKIVYISCGPDTQARDLRVLVQNGYRPVSLSSYDLFPWTEHVETVVCLDRARIL